MSIEQCRIIDLPRIEDPRGNLTFIENNRHIPFDIKRVYYTYDVPGGSERGSHAHKQLQQLIVAMSGSFDVVLGKSGEQWVIAEGVLIPVDSKIKAPLHEKATDSQLVFVQGLPESIWPAEETVSSLEQVDLSGLPSNWVPLFRVRAANRADRPWDHVSGVTGVPSS